MVVFSDVVMWRTLVVFATVISVVVSQEDFDSEKSYISRHSIPRQQCSGFCKESSKFRLLKGRTYVYSYESVVSTGIEGVSSGTSQINITAEAHLRVGDNPCDLTLLVRNARLYDSGPSGLEQSPHQTEWAESLEQWPLRLSYQDGRVDQLCPAAEELSWVLDFKRAILSALQNSMPNLRSDTHLHERDISGTCETTYTYSSNMMGDFEILRRKDLNSCTDRGSRSLGLSGALPSSTPIIRSEQLCRQKVSDRNGRHISGVECQESHIFSPFSNGQAGLRTQANLALSLMRIVMNYDEDTTLNTDLFVNRRTSLRGEFSPTTPDEHISKEDVLSTLQQLDSSSQEGVSESVPQLYDQLVRQMAALDYYPLVKIFGHIGKGRKQKFFLDALSLVGTSASVKAIYEFYRFEQISRDELDAWLSALAFHKQPTPEMLNILLQIVKENDYHPKTWLVIGAVVHAYCQHDTACQDTLEVKYILSRLSSNLGQSCHTANKEEQQLVVATLKAIGNAGVIESLDILQNCFLNNGNAMDVRLAALSATRRLPCKLQDQMPFMQLFQARDQDSELRIAAYLAAMQCPSNLTLRYISDSLQKDDVNQVLSFVWTHLANLQGSRSIWNKEIREMLQDSYLANKFKSDVRKFSRNYEISAYSDVLKMGATIDSNVVFSTKSFLPRSANLNLTIDVFGNALNLFEVGTRLEGFESMVEDLFSPTGYFPDESLRSAVKNMRSPENEKNEVIQSMSQKFNEGITDEPQGIIYARIFGNELYLTQFSSLEKLIDVKTPKKYTGKFFTESLKSLFEHKQIDYTKSIKIIDSQYTLPTVVGLPLKVAVNSTAAVSIEMKTVFDVQNIIKTQSGDVQLLISPSAVMELDGKMTVDAVFAQAGVETKGNLKTNTYLDLKVFLDRGKVLDVTVNVPRKKMEVIDVKSVVYVRQRDQLIELGGVGEVTNWDTCSGMYVPTLTGMRVCSQLMLRNASDIQDAPYFPLTGRFHYSVALQKSDDFKAYHLRLERQFQSSMGNNKGKFLLALDTPGSKRNRTLSAKLLFSSKGSSVDATLALVSPWASADLSGQLIMSGSEMSVDIKTNVGDSQVAAVQMGLRKKLDKQNIRLEPSLVVQSDIWDINFNMSGHLARSDGNQYSAGLVVCNPTEIFSFGGEVTADTGHYTGDLSLRAADIDVSVNGRLANTPSLFSCKARAKYKIGYSKAQHVDFFTKLQSNFKHSLTKRHLALNIQMSQWSQFNTKGSWVLQQGDRYFDSKADLTVGQTQWKQQLTYINNLHEQDKNFELTVNLASPTKSLDYKAQIMFKMGEDFIHTHMLAQLNKETRFISLVDYKQDGPLHKLELELASPWNRAALEAKLDTPLMTHEPQYNGTVLLKWGDITNPQWLSAGGKYLVKETATSAHHQLEGWLEGQEWEHPLRIGGDWSARAEGGLIQSLCHLYMSYGFDSYNTSAEYLKEPLLGKHDLKVDLAFLDNYYSSSFIVTNNLDVKNVTVRMDLEKTLYLTSQLQRGEQFEMQLFWDYLGDQTQNVLVQYKISGLTELAIVSMPGHYASLTIDKLGQGLSSMNITAVWGESKGSATNAILLSTYWMLDNSPFTLTKVHTKIQLSTPFIGFEQQSFEFLMNNPSPNNYSPYPIIKTVYVSSKWQKQFIDFNLSHISDKELSSTKISGEVSSSLKLIEKGEVSVTLTSGEKFLDNVIIHAEYNSHGLFHFQSYYLQSELKVSTYLMETVGNTAIFSVDLSYYNQMVQMKAVLPENRELTLDIDYHLPTKFEVNATTPFVGYERASLQYHIKVQDNSTETKLYGRAGQQFAMLSTELNLLNTGFNGVLNITSSSSVPDLTFSVEHDFSVSSNGVKTKDFAAVILKKNGDIIKSGQVSVYLTDEKSSLSSKIKSLEYILQLPGHYSSSKYTYQTQVKLTEIEVLHYLNHVWNSEKTEVYLVYEGLAFISGFVKQNDELKAELNLKNSYNLTYNIRLYITDDYSLKHQFSFENWSNWKSMLVITTPNQSLVMSNIQKSNAGSTEYVHESYINLDNELSTINLALNVDAVSGEVISALFSTSTPFTDPVEANYDLIVSTDTTSKHKLQLKYGQVKEAKVEFDVTSTDSKLDASFNVFSPYCKQLGGSLKFEFLEVNLKADVFIITDDDQMSANIGLTKNPSNPKIELNFNSMNKNILHFSCNVEVTNYKKEATLRTSYLEHVIYINGQYTVDSDKFQAGITAKSPFVNWKEILLNFDSSISQKHSMFKFNVGKEDDVLLISGTIQNQLSESNISLGYLVSFDNQKHSAAFELSKGQESGFITLIFKNNETNVVEIDLKGFKQNENINQQKSYVLNYKSIMPIDNFRNSALEIKYTCNEMQCEVIGNTSVDSWNAFFKGESKLNKDAVGYLDVKVLTGAEIIECYLKHTPNIEDTSYSWHLSRNDDFIRGAISMPNVTHGFQMKYSIESSVKEIKSINGSLSVEPNPSYFKIVSVSSINNGKRFGLFYKAIFRQNKNPNYYYSQRMIPDPLKEKFINTKHILEIHLPLKGFENIVGNLEYGLTNDDTEILEGHFTIGTVTNNISISRQLNTGDNWNVSVDLPNVFKLNSWCDFDTKQIELTAKTIPNQDDISHFSLNFTIANSILVLNISKDNAEYHVKYTPYDGSKVIFSGVYNNYSINAVLEGNLFCVRFYWNSNIPSWKEMTIEFTINDKFIFSITKEKQVYLYTMFKKTYISCSLMMEIPTMLIKIDSSYEPVLNLSLTIQSNVSGNAQKFEGAVEILQDSTRISLATPIKGFEDLTLIGNLNRNDKIGTLTFFNKEKQYQISVTTSINSKMVKLEGTVLIDKDEFTLSIGSQNGSDQEPKSTSLFVKAYKNKITIFWASLDGFYNLDKKAGIKIALSSYYNNQIIFELLSMKSKLNHNIFLNYISGIDTIYLFNSTIVKDPLNPQLLIESQFGSVRNSIEMSSNNLRNRRSVGFLFKQNDDKYLKIEGEATIGLLASEIKFAMENKDLFSALQSVDIVTNYNFATGSLINSSLIVNSVKYFELFMESYSLYSVNFRSFVKPSEYITHTYNISLLYQLGLPLTNISSYVLINNDYYKCESSFQWDQQIAATLFELTTNAGYGFENAVLSAHYKAGEVNSHKMEFVIDDSTLFHVACDVSYPSLVSFKLDLPDTLFLPYVKTVAGEYKFTDGEKKIEFHYKSGSDKQMQLDSLIMFKGMKQYEVNLTISEKNSEHLIQFSNIGWLFNSLDDNIDFRTSFIWKNNILFSSIYRKEVPKTQRNIYTLLNTIFGLENNYSWNFTTTQPLKFEFAGALNCSHISFDVRHPSTIYHNELGIKEAKLSKSFDTLEYLNVYYKNYYFTELSLEYSDYLEKAVQMVMNNEQTVSYDKIDMKFNYWEMSLNYENTCEKYNYMKCIKAKNIYNARGLAGGPARLFYVLDLEGRTVNGWLSNGARNITFGGNVNINHDNFMFSNASLYVTSSDIPDQPLSIIFNSDGKSMFYGSINILEKDARELSINTEKTSNITKISVVGTNILTLKKFSATSVFSQSSSNIMGYLDENDFDIQVQYEPNFHSLDFKSSYESLKSLKIRHEVDSSKKHNSGTVTMENNEGLLEWNFDILCVKDGSFYGEIDSNQDIKMRIVIDLNDKREIHVKLLKNGKSYEGKGIVNMMDREKFLSEGFISIDEVDFKWSIHRTVTLVDERLDIQLMTLSEDYFVQVQKNFNPDQYTPFVSLTYKTPIRPLKTGDIIIWCSTSQESSVEHLSIANKHIRYDINYEVKVFGASITTDIMNLDSLKIKVINGEKKGLLFQYLSKKIEILNFFVDNSSILALNNSVNIEGFTIPFALRFLNGKTSIKGYLDKYNENAFMSLEIPSVKPILFTLETEFDNSNSGEDFIVYNTDYNRTIKFIIDEKTYISLTSLKKTDVGQFGRRLNAEINEKVIRFGYLIQKYMANMDLLITDNDTVLVDTGFLYLDDSKNSIGNWSNSLQIFVKRFLSVPKSFLINPTFVIVREINGESMVNYKLNFTNGMTSLLSFSGNCLVSLPDLQSFSLDSKPLIISQIDIDTFSSEYTATANISLQSKQLEATIKWRAIDKSPDVEEHADFNSLEFGGLLKDKSVELYLNKNKLLVSIENVEDKTNVSAYLTIENLADPIYFVSTITYSPIFMMSISHTMFPTPCKVDVKIDLKEQSLETALNILYNSLEQQAIVNVYLDINPRYAELIYIDIWKQTHDAFFNVEEKDDEVVLRGKINSPALDENFLIVTIGKNNDKFDLNMNDAYIFKAFKDESRALLDLHFGNEYKLNVKCKNHFEISIVSPYIRTGTMTLKLTETPRTSFFIVLFDTAQYQLHLGVNTDKLLEVVVKSDRENIVNSLILLNDNSDKFEFLVECDVLHYANGFVIRHTRDPFNLTVSLNSSYFINTSFLIDIGRNTNALNGTFELKVEEKNLISSYFELNNVDNYINAIVQAPIFSEKDEAKIGGVLKMSRGELKLNLTGSVTLKNNPLCQANIYFIKEDDIFASGLVINSKLEGYENVILSLTFPLSPSNDAKAHLIVHLGKQHLYEAGIILCIPKEIGVLTAFIRWQELFTSIEIRKGITPFYSDIFEIDLYYKKTKLQIGAWTSPKYPITDYIYFLNVDDSRIIEISHSLILKDRHYKSKLILHTVLKGHEKYGIDCELKTTEKSNKILRILASVPKLGNDLGIDFGYSFDSMRNYTLLAQIRIPYNNDITMTKLYSLHQINTHLNSTRINHSLECTGLGKYGWELAMIAHSPFIWQSEMTSFETSMYLKKHVYSLYTKSLTKPTELNIDLEIKTPFHKLTQGSILFHGVKDIVGSEVEVSFNSENILHINVTKDDFSANQIDIYTKWRNVAIKYFYEVDERITLNGYFCWDLVNKETSQFGASIIAGGNNDKYNTGFEIILPSTIIPKVGVKTTLETNNGNLNSLLKVEFPGLNFEGQFLKENSKLESDLTWSLDGSQTKHIGIVAVTETGIDEIKHYFILRHFALVNDITLIFYNKHTFYGINVQYSPLKEDELTMECGYWLEDGNSGLKVVALHQTTNTLFYGVANKTETDRHTEAGVSVSYISDQEPNKIKYVEVYGNKNKKEPQLLIGLASNGNNLAVGGSLWKKENFLQGITLEGKINQKDPLKLEIVQNIADPGIDVELSYGVSRSYKIAAGMPSSNEITAELSHTMYGRPVLDALASVRLNTSRILWGKFQFPPLAQVGHEFYNGISAEYSDVNLVSEAITNGFSDFAQEDFSKKAVLLLNGISSTSEILVSETYNELGVVKFGVKSIGDILKKAYNDDHLYLKTTHLLITQTGYTLHAHLKQALQVLTSLADGVFGPALRVLHRVWLIIDSFLSQWMIYISEIGAVTPLRDMSQVVAHYQSLRANLLQQTRLALQDVQRQLEVWQKQTLELMTQAELKANELIETVQNSLVAQMSRMMNYIDAVLAGFSILADTIAEMLEIVVSGIYDIKEVRNAVNTVMVLFQELDIWIAHFKIDVYLREFNVFFNRVMRLVIQDFEKNFGEYEEYVVKALIILEGSYEELSKLPEVRYLHDIVNNIYFKAKWFWNYANLNQKLEEMVQEIIENIKETLVELDEILDEQEGELRSDYDFNAMNNTLTFTQELPFEWQAFNELPYNWNYNTLSNQRKMKTKAQQYILLAKKLVQSVWQDTKLVHSLLPPYGAIAIFTPHNIITFDNTFYDFSSDCRSYLLAADLRHNTFSLIADYQNQNKRDLILTVKDMAITIKDGLKIYINDSLVELPRKLSNGYELAIERKLNSVLIESKQGFSLECSSFLTMCTFKLSGWYVGKTAGLLGAYNNENYDEYQMLQNNKEEFIESWAIAPRSCESSNQVSPLKDYSPVFVYRCKEMFQDQSSPLAPCFLEEDPNNFYEMCSSEYSEDNSCSSIYAYINKCAAVGVPLELPTYCSANKLLNATQLSEYSDVIHSEKSVDVVFVVETCPYGDSSLVTRLVLSLADQLEDRRLLQNNFALVSFNGEGAHIHTFQGQIWSQDESQLTDVIGALEQVENSNKESQYVPALQTAASLPFHLSASKIIVLLHCSECSPASNISPSLLQSFLQNDAVLHVVQKDNLLNRQGKAVSKIFGFERSGAYLRMPANKPSVPNPQLLKQISMPQDLCTPLALGTNGTVFSLDKRVKVWSSRVANGAIPTEPWKLCENTIGYDNVPVWRCHALGLLTKMKDYDQFASNDYMNSPPDDMDYTDYRDECLLC